MSTSQGMGMRGTLRYRWRVPTLRWLCYLLAAAGVITLIVIYIGGRIAARQEESVRNSVQNHINDWLTDIYIKCNGNYKGYTNEFVWLNHARYDKSRNVFSIPCENEILNYKFLHGKEGTVLDKWQRELDMYPYSGRSYHEKEQTTPTFAVMRYEAHNLYHTLCEWFNIYVICELFHINPADINVLFMDDRPAGLMDDTWETLFADVDRYTSIKDNTVFRDLVWPMIGYESPLNFHNLDSVQYIEQFRTFFLQQFKILDNKQLNCNRLNVTIIWRRDYMTHPERQQETGGLIHRKFQNEKEILTEIKRIFEGHEINEVLLENLNMKQQLDIMTKTDILFGMHGAGMAHVLFLPQHAAVFETFPDYWGFQRHFKAFARWRGIKYIGWQNTSPKNEFPNFYTRIPIDVIRSNMVKLKDHLRSS